MKYKKVFEKITDSHGTSDEKWIGLDLDGTIAHYDHWRGIDHIGKPIPKMVERIKKWVKDGQKLKIVTARVAPYKGKQDPKVEFYIREYLKKHIPEIADIEITYKKDSAMLELWDDRAIQVIPNTGERVDGEDN